jgi:hypothetical protein
LVQKYKDDIILAAKQHCVLVAAFFYMDRPIGLRERPDVVLDTMERYEDPETARLAAVAEVFDSVGEHAHEAAIVPGFWTLVSNI